MTNKIEVIITRWATALAPSAQKSWEAANHHRKVQAVENAAAKDDPDALLNAIKGIHDRAFMSGAMSMGVALGVITEGDVH